MNTIFKENHTIVLSIIQYLPFMGGMIEKSNSLAKLNASYIMKEPTTATQKFIRAIKEI